MPDSRRQFLAQTSLGLLGAAVSLNAGAQEPTQLPPGAPSAFGTGPEVGPEVSPTTFGEAEKLARVELTPSELTQAAGSWRVNMAALNSVNQLGTRLRKLETADHSVEFVPLLKFDKKREDLAVGVYCSSQVVKLRRVLGSPVPFYVRIRRVFENSLDGLVHKP